MRERNAWRRDAPDARRDMLRWRGGDESAGGGRAARCTRVVITRYAPVSVAR